MSVKIQELFNRKTLYIFLGLFILEAVSFLGYFNSDIREIFFWIILLVVLVLSLKDLRYGVLAGALELLIGSQGYLFFSSGISLRIGLWVVVMAVWFAKWLIWFIKYLKIEKRKRGNESLFYHFRYFAAFLLLAIFVVIGALKGLAVGATFDNWFFDINGWLFFLWLMPVISVFKKHKTNQMVRDLSLVFVAGLLWLVFKSLFLMFVFSHGIMVLFEPLYSWSRENYLGEITALDGGFYRIFFQSQIYALLALILTWFSFNNISKLKGKYATYLIIFSSLLFSVVLISLSRSFWVGAITGFIIWAIVTKKKYSWKVLFSSISKIILTVVIAVLIITVVVRFPFPGVDTDFSAGQILKDRANITSDEAAISSRWSLLPVLTKEIIQSPIIGKGFGSEVRYKTSDPRVLESTVDGYYETYAFEWGWLDIWLKIGLLGVLAYFWLFYRITREGFEAKSFQPQAMGLSTTLLVLMVVNIFTPYLNHPLAIGYLIFAALIIARSREKVIINL